MKCVKFDVKTKHFKSIKSIKGKYQNKLYLHSAATRLNQFHLAPE